MSWKEGWAQNQFNHILHATAGQFGSNHSIPDESLEKGKQVSDPVIRFQLPPTLTSSKIDNVGIFIALNPMAYFLHLPFETSLMVSRLCLVTLDLFSARLRVEFVPAERHQTSLPITNIEPKPQLLADMMRSQAYHTVHVKLKNYANSGPGLENCNDCASNADQNAAIISSPDRGIGTVFSPLFCAKTLFCCSLVAELVKSVLVAL